MENEMRLPKGKTKKKPKECGWLPVEGPSEREWFRERKRLLREWEECE